MALLVVRVNECVFAAIHMTHCARHIKLNKANTNTKRRRIRRNTKTTWNLITHMWVSSGHFIE